MDGRGDSAGEDGGPFGRPLFDDPSARALSRVGVIDVGSNSVRLVVFDGAARSPAYFYNEKIMCGLGQGLATTGHLNSDGRKRALAALKRFALLVEGMGMAPPSCVATAAVREASDGDAFRAEVEAETGLKLWVIDGEEEARLSAQGVLLGWPEADGLVCDIGGSSMELAEIGGGRVGHRLTSPLGPFRLQQVGGGKKGMRKHVAAVMADLAKQFDAKGRRIYLVGGSWRAIARIDMERRGYPLTVLHEYCLTPDQVAKTIELINDSSPQNLRAETGIGEARMDLVPLASLVLQELVAAFKPADIHISSYGIREGLLYEQMPDRLRARDPLIEAARAAEKASARLPGFGRKLFEFLMPLFQSVPHERLRLIKAACLLHDTTWRAHPDYRAEVCFDNVTRANLGGLSHPERVYLGLALLHRYKNSRSGSRLEPLFSLLNQKEIKEAEILGKAMRFGAMFSIQDPADAGALRYQPERNLLELVLQPRTEALFGEVAKARFQSLANSLGADTKVRTEKG